MNNENNELSDIVLNKNSSSGSSKKMLLAIATLGIVLIAVVTLMKSCGSESAPATPQGVIPPKPAAQALAQTEDVTAKDTQEPLFEEVEGVQDDAVNDEDLDKIAKKLKEESAAPQPKPVAKPKEVTQAPKQAVHTQQKPVHPQTTNGVHYYIQVGSFTRYEPNKKFLASITKLGYSYTYHKVNINGKTLNKVLVGPFATETKARDARRILRAKVEPGAFLVKLK